MPYQDRDKAGLVLNILEILNNFKTMGENLVQEINLVSSLQ